MTFWCDCNRTCDTEGLDINKKQKKSLHQRKAITRRRLIWLFNDICETRYQWIDYKKINYKKVKNFLFLLFTLYQRAITKNVWCMRINYCMTDDILKLYTSVKYKVSTKYIINLLFLFLTVKTIHVIYFSKSAFQHLNFFLGLHHPLTSCE